MQIFPEQIVESIQPVINRWLNWEQTGSDSC